MPTAHDLDRDAGTQHEGRRRVAEVVEPHRAQTYPLHEGAKRRLDLVGRAHAAIGRREDEVLVAVGEAGGQPPLQLSTAVFPERADGLGGEGDVTPATRALRLPKGEYRCSTGMALPG